MNAARCTMHGTVHHIGCAGCEQIAAARMVVEGRLRAAAEWSVILWLCAVPYRRAGRPRAAPALGKPCRRGHRDGADQTLRYQGGLGRCVRCELDEKHHGRRGSKLGPLYEEIVRCKAKGESSRAIAARLGCSRQQVDYILKRMRERAGNAAVPAHVAGGT